MSLTVEFAPLVAKFFDRFGLDCATTSEGEPYLLATHNGKPIPPSSPTHSTSLYLLPSDCFWPRFSPFHPSIPISISSLIFAHLPSPRLCHLAGMTEIAGSQYRDPQSLWMHLKFEHETSKGHSVVNSVVHAFTASKTMETSNHMRASYIRCVCVTRRRVHTGLFKYPPLILPTNMCWSCHTATVANCQHTAPSHRIQPAVDCWHHPG